MEKILTKKKKRKVKESPSFNEKFSWLKYMHQTTNPY